MSDSDVRIGNFIKFVSSLFSILSLLYLRASGDYPGVDLVRYEAEYRRKYGKKMRPGLFFVVLTNCGRKSATHIRFRTGEVDLMTYTAIPRPGIGGFHERMFQKEHGDVLEPRALVEGGNKDKNKKVLMLTHLN